MNYTPWRRRQWFLLIAGVLLVLSFVQTKGHDVPLSPSPSDEVSPDGVESDEVSRSTVAEAPSAVTPFESVAVQVVDVVDGDTFKVKRGGSVATVRVVGIDTPETVHPSKPVECYGLEASARAKALLSGAWVVLITDVTQGEQDKYGRVLAYVQLPDGRDFGEVMIRDGYAYEYTYDGWYAQQALYQAAEDDAVRTGAGLWAEGACGQLSQTEAVSFTSVTTAASETCLIKGNISVTSQEKIFHVPGQEYYEKTVIDERKGERWFCSESEAIAAGWRKALQ